MGFGDAAVLAMTIMDGMERGEDIGSISLLHHYQNNRLPYNMAMITGVDSISRLFSFSFPPLVVLRNLGLLGVHSFHPLKNIFAKLAFGTIDVSRIGEKSLPN